MLDHPQGVHTCSCSIKPSLRNDRVRWVDEENKNVAPRASGSCPRLAPLEQGTFRYKWSRQEQRETRHLTSCLTPTVSDPSVAAAAFMASPSSVEGCPNAVQSDWRHRNHGNGFTGNKKLMLRFQSSPFLSRCLHGLTAASLMEASPTFGAIKVFK